jgi:hypothetical protein
MIWLGNSSLGVKQKSHTHAYMLYLLGVSILPLIVSFFLLDFANTSTLVFCFLHFIMLKDFYLFVQRDDTMPQSIGPSNNMSEWSGILGAKCAENIKQIQTLFRTAKREMEKQKLVNIALYTKFNIGPYVLMLISSLI